MSRLLIVDDEPSICWALARLGRRLGHVVTTASCAEEALAAVQLQAVDAIMLDVRLPRMDGLTLMPLLREQVGDVPIVVMTAYGDLQTAVEAVRQGAFDYLVKPFDLAIAERTLSRVTALSKPGVERCAGSLSTSSPGGIVGRSAAMQDVFKRIALVAASGAGAHIVGESGTGKELVALAIHQYSNRSSGPFVVVNMASLSESLAEAELFGHTRGAFTGAVDSRSGLLERADGGTLFLDEVAEIPLPLQVKLLRVLEYGEIVPVGSSQSQRVDFRLISATHRDLSAAVTAGAFREDLYYRLNTFRIRLPPLRERLDDLPLLVEHFVTELSQRVGLQNPGVAPETIAALIERPWKGNVRELRNAVEQALVLARGGLIEPDHLPPMHAVGDGPVAPAEGIAAAVRKWAADQWTLGQAPENVYQKLLALVEPAVLEEALQRNHGQFASAARQLGLHRITLRKKWEAIAEKSSSQNPPSSIE